MCMHLGERKRKKGRGEQQRGREAGKRRGRENKRERKISSLESKFLRVGIVIGYLYSTWANLETTKGKLSTNVINY